MATAAGRRAIDGALHGDVGLATPAGHCDYADSVNRRQVLQALAVAALLVLTVFGGSALRTSGAAPSPLPAGSSSQRLVVIGTGGMSPADIDPARTPNLWRLLRQGSSAALNITAVHVNTCPVDGWLTLSAGGRAGQSDAGARVPPCQPIPSVTNGQVTGWKSLVATAASRPYGSTLGTLSQALASKGQCISAIGPGAALGAALPSGAVPHFSQFNASALSSGLAACPTSLVDVGAIRDPGDVDPADPVQPTASHEQQLAAIDQRVGQVVAAAPGGADVMVVSLADAGQRPGLRVVMAAGQRFAPGTLYSPSTRQSGLVQLDDVTATILDHAGVAVPAQVSGSALQPSPAANSSAALAQSRRDALVDYQLSSRWVQPVVYPFFVTWVALMLAALSILALTWRRALGSQGFRQSLRVWVRKGLVVSAAVPAATYLANIVPWWRFAWPPVALVLATAAWSALLGAIALRGPWRRSPMGPVAAVAAMTFVVLAADVVNGSRLQLASLLGLNPVVGGRYFGLGNVAFALFAAATFLVAIALSSPLVRAGRPRLAALTVTIIGAVSIVVVAMPNWGGKVGGPPALIPGLAVLVLSILHVRLNWAKVLLIGGGTAVLVLIIALLDWLRPPQSRSHLGRFVQSVIDGGAGDIINRKLAQNLDTLIHTTVFAYLVPLLLIALAYVLLRPGSRLAQPVGPLLEQVETLRAGLIGLTVTMAVGLLVNDTGVAIPPVALALAAPLLISAGIRTWELGSQQAPVTTKADRRQHNNIPASPGPPRT